MAFVTGTACTTHGYEHMVTECSACQASKLDRLRAELAAAEGEADRLRGAYDDVRAMNIKLTTTCTAELAAKNARIAQLEAWRAACQEVRCYRVVEAETEALRKQLAEFGAGEDTTTMTRKSFVEVLQALADVQKELAASRKWNQDLLDAARETRPDDDRRAAEWGLAVFADLKKTQKELAEANAQLPDGMKHCTIQFKECEKGHGWLTATNWVPQECPTCTIEAAKTRIAELEERIYRCAFDDVPQMCSWPECECDPAIKNLRARAARAEVEVKLLKEHVRCTINERELATDMLRSAEAQLAEIEEKWRFTSVVEANAERAEAECKTMREALKFALDFKITDSSNQEVAEDSLHEIRKIARAALNPSPAGREG